MVMVMGKDDLHGMTQRSFVEMYEKATEEYFGRRHGTARQEARELYAFLHSHRGQAHEAKPEMTLKIAAFAAKIRLALTSESAKRKMSLKMRDHLLGITKVAMNKADGVTDAPSPSEDDDDDDWDGVIVKDRKKPKKL